MPAQSVLRFRRTDVDASVLVSVTRTGPDSPPLALSLVGTDGLDVFAGSIHPARIKQLRAATYHGGDQEWEAILSHGLLQARLDGDDARALDGLEIVASISHRQLSIKLRKNISGITQTLGCIPLQQDLKGAIEIEFFDWTAVAVDAAAAAREEARNLQAKYEAQHATINKLNAQLRDLIQAKQDHENLLLAKFQELLNGKKLKIRDQQRLLAGANVDPAAVVAVENARESKRDARARRAGPSRASKRKAHGKTPESSESGLDEEDAEARREREEEMAEAATPEKSDLDETEDEDDSFDAVAPSRPSRSGAGAKGKAVETATQKQKPPQPRPQQSPEAPPPRRELPFARKSGQPKPGSKPAEQAAVAAQEDDEDETTDDDEL